MNNSKNTNTNNTNINNYGIARFDIAKSIEDRIAYLTRQKAIVAESIKLLPEGNLLVAPGTEPTNFRYYNRTTPQDKQGQYLNKSQFQLKKDLAQKKYYQILLKEIEVELCKLNRILRQLSPDSIIDTYSRLNNGIKKLINPLNIDDATYIARWEALTYEGLKFDTNDETEFFSERGERMRSKSEVLIANALLHSEVPYRYEYPLKLLGSSVFYPDFTVLQISRRRHIIWEHLGKMNDTDYVARNMYKLDIYQRNGIVLGDNLVITYETDRHPLGTRDIEKVISRILNI